MAANGAPADGPRPGWGALACAWAGAVVLLVVPLPAEVALSRLALAALPFVALAGVPARREHRATHAPGAAALLWLAVALGPLVLGARLDQLEGVEVVRLVRIATVALAAVFLLAFGARAACGGGVHAAAWGLVVLGPALAGAVLALFAGAGAADGLRPAWSPLGWVWTCAREPVAASDFAALAPPLLVGLALAATGRGLRGARA